MQTTMQTQRLPQQLSPKAPKSPISPIRSGADSAKLRHAQCASTSVQVAEPVVEMRARRFRRGPLESKQMWSQMAKYPTPPLPPHIAPHIAELYGYQTNFNTQNSTQSRPQQVNTESPSSSRAAPTTTPNTPTPVAPPPPPPQPEFFAAQHVEEQQEEEQEEQDYHERLQYAESRADEEEEVDHAVTSEVLEQLQIQLKEQRLQEQREQEQWERFQRAKKPFRPPPAPESSSHVLMQRLRQTISNAAELIAMTASVSRMSQTRLQIIQREVDHAVQREQMQIERLKYAIENKRNTQAYYSSLFSVLKEKEEKEGGAHVPDDVSSALSATIVEQALGGALQEAWETMQGLLVLKNEVDQALDREMWQSQTLAFAEKKSVSDKAYYTSVEKMLQQAEA